MIGRKACVGQNQQRSFLFLGIAAMLKAQTTVIAKALALSIVAIAGNVALAAIPAAIPSQQQSLEVLGAPAWQAAGYQGQGIRIAVLDTGFRGYRSHLGQCLPWTVECRSFRRDANLEARNSEHGILCGEIIHRIAPAADLLFANWEDDRPEQFLEAVAWARNRGARIVSCSLIMPSWSDGEGGGAIEQRLQRLIAAGGPAGDSLFFASAGNTALRHWYGPFHAGPEGWHQWRAGASDNMLAPWTTEPISVELYCRGAASYELLILDAGGGTVAGGVSGTDGKRAWSVAKFEPKGSGTYRIRVRRVGGDPSEFHLVALGASLSETVASGSVCCPADARGVVAVGAMAVSGQSHGYSSYTATQTCTKPELMAIVPFASSWRSRPFSGTSAAAPQAAGAAALYWSRFPTKSAADVKGALYQAAHRLLSVTSSEETPKSGQVVLPNDLPRQVPVDEAKASLSLR
jgi:subtilisin family serine protease